DAEECLSLKNATCGTADIVILLKRGLDEFLQLIVLEYVPPFLVRQRFGVSLARFVRSQSAIDGWRIDRRLLVVRTDSTPRDEDQGGHKDWPQPQSGSFQGRIDQGLTLIVLVLGEFNDQNGILGGKADQHDQSNLGINIAFDLHHVGRVEGTDQHASEPENHKRSEYRDWRTEQDAKRQDRKSTRLNSSH